MIRAVFSHGSIVPIDELPADWEKEKSLLIEPDPDGDNPLPEELQKWFDDLQALGTAEYEPGEIEQMEALMAEADRQAKEFVRREMGLP